MRLPRLMRADLGEVGLLHPSKFTLSVEMLALGGAKMSLPDGEPVVGFRQWVEHVMPAGGLVMYRVSSAPLNCGKEQKVSLSHGIVTLEDELMPADTEISGTPRGILAALLGYQRTARWRLGAAPDTGQYKLEAKGGSVLRAFFDALELFGDLAPVYDFTATPWTVGLRALSAEPSCECRLSRNIAGVTIDYDDGDFCTRVCAPQLPGGHLVADTAAEWGEVSRDLRVAEDAPAGEVLDYAQRYLERHKQPAIYAEVDALEISRQTGEPLDCFAVGTVCRCALPDYGITVNAPIVAMRYDDLVGKPHSVRLSLGRKIKDASYKFERAEQERGDNESGVRRAGSGLRRAGAGIAELQTTLIEQGDSIIRLHAWGETVDGALGEAMILIDGLNSDILLRATKTEVAALGSRVSAAEVDIDGANAAIALRATKAEFDALGTRVSGAEAELLVQADAISTKVSRNGVISAINQTPESVTIQAGRINLSGYVTASALSASMASLQSAYAASFATDALGAGSCAVTNVLSANNRFVFKGSDISKREITVLKSITPASTESVTLLVA